MRILRKFIERIKTEYKLWKLRRQDPYTYDEED